MKKRVSDRAIKDKAKEHPDWHWCDAWPGRCWSNRGEWTGDPAKAHKKPICRTCLTLGEQAKNIRRIESMSRANRKKWGK